MFRAATTEKKVAKSPKDILRVQISVTYVGLKYQLKRTLFSSVIGTAESESAIKHRENAGESVKQNFKRRKLLWARGRAWHQR